MSKQILYINSLNEINTLINKDDLLMGEYKVIKDIFNHLEKHISNLISNYLYVTGKDTFQYNGVNYNLVPKVVEYYNIHNAIENNDSIVAELDINKTTLISILNSYLYNTDNILEMLTKSGFYSEFTKIQIKPVFLTEILGIDINKDYSISFNPEIGNNMGELLSFFEENSKIMKVYDSLLGKRKREIKKIAEKEDIDITEIEAINFLENKSRDDFYMYYLTQKEVEASQLVTVKENGETIIDFLYNYNNLVRLTDFNKILTTRKGDIKIYLEDKYGIYEKNIEKYEIKK